MFNAWLGVEVVAEAEATEEVIAERPSDAEKIAVEAGDTKAAEMMKVFREKVKEREEVHDEHYAEKMEDAQTPREARFVWDLTRLWREASWIMVTGDFPDGKSMHSQFHHHLHIWSIFVSALTARQMGAGEQ